MRLSQALLPQSLYSPTFETLYRCCPAGTPPAHQASAPAFSSWPTATISNPLTEILSNFQIMQRMSLQCGALTLYKYVKREYSWSHMCQAL